MSDLEPHAVPDAVLEALGLEEGSGAFGPHTVDYDGWRLEISGAVADPLRLSRRDLESFPLETATEDFDCVEGWRADDLAWRGVRVERVLGRARPVADESHALVRALDGDYACSFPLERLSTALLALELDGEPLPLEHGGPARLVPLDGDDDCWESVKWVSAIEIGDGPFGGDDTAKERALSRLE
ncbi:Oxidoreductase molybdopterin binding domain-containing protein [Halobiforma haloterrestris]|uniref:Oxidoreductase molybdopterin binding domain-containing protein n=1 Tax=Natronobacterium haloterrestre TaxID=148448 RepID=A0A1I1J915_NATHA|nr:molybdopterin-dependent oxidoreductase [Halobiforma haloterrestris]SFC41920.1 Oxidoreductase molybdopterin binding domain-containing protein [Halobiforma haloterrestris]